MYQYSKQNNTVYKVNEEGIVLGKYKVRKDHYENEVVTVYESGKARVLQLWKVIAAENGLIPASELTSAKRGRGKYSHTYRPCGQKGRELIVIKNDTVIGKCEV